MQRGKPAGEIDSQAIGISRRWALTKAEGFGQFHDDPCRVHAVAGILLAGDLLGVAAIDGAERVEHREIVVRDVFSHVWPPESVECGGRDRPPDDLLFSRGFRRARSRRTGSGRGSHP